MRSRTEVALLLCVCLWIPGAQTRDAAPEDQDASGDEEFSGSGSGDSDLDAITLYEMTTRATLNATTSAWVPDPVVHLEDSVTKLLSTVPTKAETETPGSGNQSPLLQTTQIPETQPTSASIMDLNGSVDETTSIQDEVESTTVPPVELPVVPTVVEPVTTTSTEGKKETTVSVLKEDGGDDDDDDEETTKVLEEGVNSTPETPAIETTQTTTDLYTSGDTFETTTLNLHKNTVEPDIIPVIKNNENKENDDFIFENEIGTKTRAELPDNNVSLGASSDDGSLLERKEVLAGVIAGGVVGLAFAVMLVALMVYRMKKKDEGSYALDEHNHPNGGYQKPQRQEEFLA